jgi:hypothetical protein
MAKQSSRASSAPRHSWRENAREFLIVVAGVFVALVAQQAVEAWDWHRKVDASETAMRSELLSDDGPQIYQRLAMHPCVVAQLQQIRAAVVDGRSRHDIGALVDGYWIDVRGYDRLALDAANTSDVASHMPEEVLENYFTVYQAMPLYGEANKDEGVGLARLRAFRRSGGSVSDEEKDRLLQTVEQLRNDDHLFWRLGKGAIPRLRGMGQLDPTRVHTLMAQARAHYGDCIKPLPASFPKGAPAE